ncbi:MAG: TRAP transporter large permease [Myxococcota bacterium]
MVGFRKPGALGKGIWLGVLAIVLLIAFGGGDLFAAAPVDTSEFSDGEGKSGGGLLLLAALAAMIVLGSPLFVIIGVLAAMCFSIYGEGYEISPCLTLNAEAICGYDVFPTKMADLTTKNVLLAIPFFVVSGAIMSEGDIANRLVAFARALVGWLPGGLAIATVGGCIFFAAISGSSPVTVIAIGSMMFPALVKAGYSERFSMGLVTTAGSLGILIPPSIPMLVFAIVAGGRTPLDVGELFMAGIVPGLMIGGLLSIYAVMLDLKRGGSERAEFSLGDVLLRFKEGFWAIMLPVLILGGIYSGLFTATEAAAVSVIYALVVELGIHREIGTGHLPKILADAAVMMGTLLIIMALAFGLNDFLVEEKIPDQAVALIQEMDLSPVQFLLIMNLLLLVVGALMDSISAIMIIAPLLKPISDQLGIDPVHLGVIFIVNLEIGYLTPPIGINLFVASSVFNKAMGEVIKSVVPFILLMFVGLGIVTYIPSVSLGMVNIFLRDKPFYQGLPQIDASGKVVVAGVPDDGPKILKPGEKSADGKVKVLSMQEMTEITEHMLAACDAADTAVSDNDTFEERVASFKEELDEEEVTNATVLEVLAPAIAGTKGSYAAIAEQATALMKGKWTCEPLEEMLSDGEAAAGSDGSGDGAAGDGAAAEGDAAAPATGAAADADGAASTGA